MFKIRAAFRHRNLVVDICGKMLGRFNFCIYIRCYTCASSVNYGRFPLRHFAAGGEKF